jgi:hypothetical protein
MHVLVAQLQVLDNLVELEKSAQKSTKSFATTTTVTHPDGAIPGSSCARQCAPIPECVSCVGTVVTVTTTNSA